MRGLLANLLQSFRVRSELGMPEIFTSTRHALIKASSYSVKLPE